MNRRNNSLDVNNTVGAKKFEETLALASTLDHFRYLDEGGLGVIFVAEDKTLKRDTAVKFLHDHLTTDGDSREQFLLEAEVTARLEHPGVVAVYGLGESNDGRLFYTMRLVNGETFDEAIQRFHQPREIELTVRDRQVQFHELLGRFVAVCETIAYAHNRGILHRDIKPKNVMLGRYGETVVIDWGLAIPVAREGVFKDSGERTLTPSSPSDSSKKSGGGTPAYMSPEQAEGGVHLGPSSDIYSLGAMLYKIITHEVPVSGENVREIREKVIRGDFAKPSQVKRNVSRALEAICLKAMASDPEERYPTALELAKDINRYLADARVWAYKEPLWLKLARWGRRHHSLAHSLLASLIALTLIGAVVAAWQGSQANRERQLRVEADAARESERNLRKHGLQVSAEFAARTIASQIDVRWRILEKVASDPKLHQYLKQINVDLEEQPSLGPDDQENRVREAFGPLQQYLNKLTDQDDGPYRWTGCRSWFIHASEGTQVARFPYQQTSGKPFDSLGKNYAFRDYFHGDGQDYPLVTPVDTSPLDRPHNSTAIKSTNGGDLVVSLSVPIRENAGSEILGVLGMSIELGSFADLQIDLPEEQGVLLVESRRYHMLSEDLMSYDERGDGLVLHHEELRDLMMQNAKILPHVTDEIVDYMRAAQSKWQEGDGETGSFDNLLPDYYRDPLNRDDRGKWLAAFAPVLVKGRQSGATGWFVIVQQRQ